MYVSFYSHGKIEDDKEMKLTIYLFTIIMLYTSMWLQEK